MCSRLVVVRPRDLEGTVAAERGRCEDADDHAPGIDEHGDGRLGPAALGQVVPVLRPPPLEGLARGEARGPAPVGDIACEAGIVGAHPPHLQAEAQQHSARVQHRSQAPSSGSPLGPLEAGELGGRGEVGLAVGVVDEGLAGVAAAQVHRVVDGIVGALEGNDVRVAGHDGPQHVAAAAGVQAGPTRWRAWYDGRAMMTRSTLLALLLAACGDSSQAADPSSTSTTVEPASLGLGEPCNVDDDQCKEGMVCTKNISSTCPKGMCSLLCTYDGTEPDNDDVPGDPGCPFLEEKPSFCRRAYTGGPRVCGWSCLENDECPQSFSQELTCLSAASCLVANLCEEGGG